MQKRNPVGSGPSGNTWPRCAPQWLQFTSSRCMPWLVSLFVAMFSALIGCQKLGQPLPESYLVEESNRGLPQHTQR